VLAIDLRISNPSSDRTICAADVLSEQANLGRGENRIDALDHLV
jgi:hypothetical protein